MKRLLATTMMLAVLPAPALATPGFCEDLRLLIASLPDRPAVLATRRCLPGARRDDDPAGARRGEARAMLELLSITIGQDAAARGGTGGTVRLVVSIPEG